MKLLALDTATEACSVALVIDGATSSKYEVAPQQHSSLILPMVDQLIVDAQIEKSDLDVIAFTRGPGSFMGVRIATGIVQGLAFALDIPVIPVSTLGTIARVIYNETGNRNIACAIDARKGEVYWACYQIAEDGIPKLVGDEIVCPPQEAILPGRESWYGAGTGWGAYDGQLTAIDRTRLNEVSPDCLPNAEAVAQIAASDYERGQYMKADQAVPVYLRNDVAKTITEREAEKSTF